MQVVLHAGRQDVALLRREWATEIRGIFEAAQNVDIALVGIGLIAENTPGFCSLAESYGVSVRRLRQWGVVGEINYQPFDADGHIVDRPELRALMHRVLSVEGDRLRVIDAIVPEPVGGAHRDWDAAAANLKSALGEHLSALIRLESDALIADRYEKFRRIGAYEESALPTRP